MRRLKTAVKFGGSRWVVVAFMSVIVKVACGSEPQRSY